MSAETFLIVGGTGTFGREATRQLLAHEDVRKVRILSRDEKKQADLKAEFPELQGKTDAEIVDWTVQQDNLRTREVTSGEQLSEVERR